jgi:hypothetical protein
MAERQALNDAYRNAITPDENGQPQINADSLSQALAKGGHGSAIPQILEGINKYQTSHADLLKKQQDLQEHLADTLGFGASAIKASNYDPNVAGVVLDRLGNGPQVQKMKQLLQSNPSGFKQMVDTAIAQSPAQQKIATELEVAKIRAPKGPEGEMPLGADKVSQLNQGLARRFQVLNAGKTLPAEYTLPASATQKDFDRVDKLLTQTESAQGTKAQQAESNAFRAATLQLARDAAAERQEKQDIQPVSGTDPKTGKEVLVSMDEAKNMGLTGVMKADADLVNKAHAARTWLKLADKQGSTADTMGLLQLIDKLDKEGKLGPIASRWNDFLAGKVGAGDPDYAALRAKIGLGNTKLMQAHVGSRGGAFMLEHFEDLANAKKMDARTLRSGVKSELDYMRDVALMPGQAGDSSSSGGAGKLPSFKDWQNSKKP